MSGGNHSRKRNTPGEGVPPDKLIPFLTAPGLAVRTVRAAGVGALLFLTAWYVSYLFLPAGYLRAGTAGGGAIPAGGAVIAAAVLAGNLAFRLAGLPLGYLAAAWGFLYAGVAAGTNSFLVPYSERIPPTFRIFSRGIVLEMAAWAVLAAASSGWALFRADRPGAAPERTSSRPARGELAVAGAGAALLAAALVLEAWGILPA